MHSWNPRNGVFSARLRPSPHSLKLLCLYAIEICLNFSSLQSFLRIENIPKPHSMPYSIWNVLVRSVGIYIYMCLIREIHFRRVQQINLCQIIYFLCTYNILILLFCSTTADVRCFSIILVCFCTRNNFFFLTLVHSFVACLLLFLMRLEN